MDISRWRKPPDPGRMEIRPGWGGGTTGNKGDFRRPSGTHACAAALPGGLRHRLISISPAGLA